VIDRNRGRRRLFDASGLPLLALGGAVLVFLAAPIVLIEQGMSWHDVSVTYHDPQTRAALVTSLTTATVSTAIIALLGVPLAYLLARLRFPGKMVISVLIFLPLVLPPVSAGILLLVLYGPYGTVGQLLSPHGLSLVDSASGIVIAQVFVSAPFAVVAARSSFDALDPEFEEAAASMGANLWQSFYHVALPMARAGILAGLVLSWMRALGEFGATVILAYHPYSLPVLNFVDLSSTGLTESLPLALLALIVTGAALIVLFFMERVDWGSRFSRL
jgi:ABC-type sulfate transport system permease component